MNGKQATFENLIYAFESAGYQQYADDVRRLCEAKGQKFSVYWKLRTVVFSQKSAYLSKQLQYTT